MATLALLMLYACSIMATVFFRCVVSALYYLSSGVRNKPAESVAWVERFGRDQ